MTASVSVPEPAQGNTPASSNSNFHHPKYSCFLSDNRSKEYCKTTWLGFKPSFTFSCSKYGLQWCHTFTWNPAQTQFPCLSIMSSQILLLILGLFQSGTVSVYSLCVSALKQAWSPSAHFLFSSSCHTAYTSSPCVCLSPSRARQAQVLSSFVAEGVMWIEKNPTSDTLHYNLWHR